MLTKALLRKFSAATAMHVKNIALLGIKNRNLILNPSVPELYEIALLKEPPGDPNTR